MASGQGSQGPRSGSAPRTWYRIAWPAALAFVAANLLLLVLVDATELDRSPVDIRTRLAYQARIDGFFESGSTAPRAVFVGDSLVFGAHLREHEGPDWKNATPSEHFARLTRGPDRAGHVALNLGINGVLFNDLQCVVQDVLARKPDVLVIGVSPRPFSSDFAAEDAESARPFLCPKAPSDALERLRQTATELARRAVPAFRYRDLLQLHLLDATPRAFVVQQVLSLLRPDVTATEETDAEEEEEQALLAQMMQRMRAAQRYNSIEIRGDHPQARGLEQLLHALRAQRDTRVLVFYLSENTAWLAGALDVAHYEAQSRRFSELMQNSLASAPRARFVRIESGPFLGEYTDHIHLTSAGYARLASRIAQELPP